MKDTQRIFLRHAGNDDKVFATIRLSSEQYWALRAAMHTPKDIPTIRFEHGVYLYPSGFGWYKLYASNEFRATEKVRAAIQTITSIIYRLARAAEQSTKGIITTQQPVAFSTDAGYHTVTVVREKTMGQVVAQVRRPPTESQLAALAARFGRK